MKFLWLSILIASINAVSYYDLVQEQWAEFKLTYHKKYDDATEDKYRMKIYMDNAHSIIKHNQLYEDGLATFKMKLNQWADLLPYEFTQMFNGYNRNFSNGIDEARTEFIPPEGLQLPDEIDWRREGAVTAIKDQGGCGSCWCFSVTGALEGQFFRKTGDLVAVSEQNLIDCSQSYGNYGCNGGLMDNAYKYVKDNGGIDTEASYPYEGTDGYCRYNPSYSAGTVTGLVDITPGDEEELQEAVASVGPISVAIDASLISFQFYSEGLYYEPSCSSINLDHGVLAIGYGTEAEGDYWLVKNSWGTNWGESGYIKMSRNRNNNCGIASMASYPLV